jgi:hypothetical protein
MEYHDVLATFSSGRYLSLGVDDSAEDIFVGPQAAEDTIIIGALGEKLLYKHSLRARLVDY